MNEDMQEDNFDKEIQAKINNPAPRRHHGSGGPYNKTEKPSVKSQISLIGNRARKISGANPPSA